MLPFGGPATAGNMPGWHVWAGLLPCPLRLRRLPGGCSDAGAGGRWAQMRLAVMLLGPVSPGWGRVGPGARPARPASNSISPGEGATVSALVSRGATHLG